MPETDDDLMTMTREDADAAFADAALLGTGSVEQHSIHLPVSVDTLRAEHLTEELVDATADHEFQFVRLPTLPYGESEHHMNFGGTITLSPDTYEDVVSTSARASHDTGSNDSSSSTATVGTPTRSRWPQTASSANTASPPTSSTGRTTPATVSRSSSATSGATPATTKPASSNTTARTWSNRRRKRPRPRSQSPRRGPTPTSRNSPNRAGWVTRPTPTPRRWLT